MEQLKMKDLINLYYRLRQTMTTNEVLELPIYLGQDDELNGIHTAWFCQPLDKKDKSEDMQYLVEMIDSSFGNVGLKDKGVLIS